MLKKVTKQHGILEKVIAFAPAHEEQGRKTLHSHWQIWVEDYLPMSGNLCGKKMKQYEKSHMMNFTHMLVIK